MASFALVLLLAALFLAGGLALSRGYRAEDTARTEVQQTRTFLRELSDLTLLLLDAETSQQAYLLTGAAAARRAFEAARDALPPRLIALEGAIAKSHAGAPDGITTLKALARDRMAALDAGASAETVAPGQADAGAVEAGQAATGALRREIDRLRGAELARLDRAFADADLQRNRVRLALGLIGATTSALAVLAAGLAFRTARDQARLGFVDRLAAERDRADLVSRELSHRVKNLFAVILSIISVTARAERDPRVAAQKSRLRIQALARAYELSSSHSALGTAELSDLLQAVVGAYAPAADRFRRHGPPVVLPARLMTPIGLIVNELATNALKHGAWSGPEGTLSLSWAFGQHCRLHLTWAEQGALPPQAEAPGAGPGTDGGSGFGSRMIDLSLQQAAGRMTRHWDDTGLTVEMSFDLTEDEVVAARVHGA
ncbi:HWE histidine kinase domain-containing protein [Frigidibacter sp. MR17.24]|uniref:HWE histidine kinase domain-containing protein n=1 Tax=Frigidibacter sp. MR17.24 TaxID=3127345 RepID=UPI003012C196